MTRDPPRLRDAGGASRKLLRAADMDRPSSAARRRALAVAGAVTTLGATSAVAAASSGAVAKGVLFWVCVGAAGGSTMALAVSELVQPAASHSSSVAPAGAAPARAAAIPNRQAVSALPQPYLPSSAAAPTAPAAPAFAGPQAATAVEPWLPGLPAPSAASFDDDQRGKPTLFEELRLIEAARASVGRGAPSPALSVLDAYDRAYPGGQFQPEALALRIQALSQSGDKVGARAQLAQFQRRYPRHPLLARVLAAAGD